MPTAAGVAVVVSGYLVDQVARGWDVAVACPDGEGWLASATLAAGARVLPWSAGRNPGPGTLGETRRLAALIAAHDPDIVHLHSAKAGLAGRLAVRGRRPAVYQPHGWSFFAVRGPVRAATVAWERWALRWTDALVCVSESERATGRTRGVYDADTPVVPNGIDCAAVQPADESERRRCRARLRLPPDVPIAACVGRLCEAKGQADLLPAWERVGRTVPAAELVLVGDGPDRASLSARATGLPGVRFAGDRDDVADWLAAANVVVAPSRWDGMSLALLEAMGRARSVVATDVPGAREAVPADAGVIVAPGDGATLAREVAARLSDRAAADAEGRAGREHVVRHHDRTKIAPQIAAVYDAVVRRRGR